MNKFQEFVSQSMAATGFCVVDSAIAARLRPDLWPDARQCSGDFALARKRGFTIPAGAAEYLLRLGGVDHDLQLLARHPHGLLERVQWITGLDAVTLVPQSDLQGTVQPLDIQPKPATAQRGDVHAGVATAEGPRTCGDCNWLSAGGKCNAADESGIQLPLAREPRRCRAFRPSFEAIDQRVGSMLWPEIFV
ncbi:MAG: hypothetical protein KBF66_13510 [Rhodoferax sp.]|uniref:hypothetical protein n=1 Tax=Rhodoferax sp. TaxID=50421 RepID=UPI001B772F73|nr:hypothetical protein [Rhodoferax sp.]MBP9906573.1 hypothetical protein [Rhodoferax sp.]